MFAGNTLEIDDSNNSKQLIVDAHAKSVIYQLFFDYSLAKLPPYEYHISKHTAIMPCILC